MANEAYPITYAVLGLLGFTGPLSGYDLKQVFDSALAPVWYATHTQIYNELRRLEGLGWVTMERQEQETRPAKKIYALNAAGQAALGTWQAGRPARGMQLRDEVLLRWMFGTFASPVDLAATLRAALADHEKRLALYRWNATRLPAAPDLNAPGSTPPYGPDVPADPFFVALAAFALKFETMYIDGLRDLLAHAESHIPPGAD